ncbi:MAG: reactive intermediate/imine deaminase [Armatimonadetes bacterium]|nr:reactive intermediate/imine deaminase [Armatimonadota bacterium]
MGEGVVTPVGPYSQAVRWGSVVFCSGQLGLDPGSGKLVEGVEAQARQALTNIGNLLKAAGSDLAHVVKATVFLVDMAAFPVVNPIYAEFMGDNRPARSTVQVAALPLGGLVEIEVIAYIAE